MSNSNNFNSKSKGFWTSPNSMGISGDVYALQQRLIRPESEEQIEADFEFLATLPEEDRQNVLDAVIGLCLDQIDTMNEPANREAASAFAERLKSDPRPMEVPNFRDFLRRSQLDAHVLARLVEEKKGDVPPVINGFVERLRTMSDEEFADPHKHMELQLSILEDTAKPIQNPFKKPGEARPADPTTLNSDIRISKPLRFKR